jgi:acyl transferase domain-containing protein/dienelactone hydrolase/acyl carrier protein
MTSEASAARDRHGRPDGRDVAIVGIGCRLPGGISSSASFWQFLRDRREAIAPIPASRYDVEALYRPEPQTPGAVIQREGGYLDDVAGFDAVFFDISPREAAYIDPQQRLALEVAWEAFEDAGLPRGRLTGSRTGVFVGQWSSDYEDRMYQSIPGLKFHATTGGGRYSTAGRVSFAFDLLGPAMVIDTACSSSQVAIHLACQSLYTGEVELALAGGVNLILGPQISIAYSFAGMLSPDARCRFADAAANGFVRSEGVALLVLKRLPDALRDGDRIYAVIAGSVVNNDGRTSGSLVKPSVDGQADMLREACRAAALEPDRIDYVECHGTGTPAGDPVELAALGRVLGAARRPEAGPLRVGSVKTNIGHTEAAAGATGTVKAALALYWQEIPASLHFSAPAAGIDLTALNLAIPTAAVPWPSSGKVRHAGVSSFGITGTNAHLILREPPVPREGTATADEWHVLPLSARSPEALRASAGAWIDFLADAEALGLPLPTIAYNAAVRRTHFESRFAAVGTSWAQLRERLQEVVDEPAELDPDTMDDATQAGAGPVFVCSGQGPRFWPIDQALLRDYPAFSRTLQRCDEILAALSGWSLLAALTADTSPSDLEQTQYAQPALCAIQIAVATLLRSWGVVPGAVIGHSMGEVAAAHLSGALSLEDTMRVIYHRGRLLQTCCGRGKTAVVALSAAELERRIADHPGVAIAAINSPASAVLAGDPAAVTGIVRQLEAENIFARLLESVDFAAHSHHMDAVHGPMQEALAGLAPQAAAIPLWSTCRGREAAGEELDALYWADNLRRPVRFAETLSTMLAAGLREFVEIGVHPVLAKPVTQCAEAAGAAHRVIETLNCHLPAPEALSTAIGNLYTAGVAIDFGAMLASQPVVSLPHYAWQREHLWFPEDRPDAIRAQPWRTEPDPTATGRPAATTPATVFTFEPRPPAGDASIWRIGIAPAWHAALAAHRLRGRIVVPGAFLCAAALAVVRHATGAGAEIRALDFAEAMFLADGEALDLTAVVRPTPGGHAVELRGRAGELLHARGTVVAAPSAAGEGADFERATAECDEELASAEHYNALRVVRAIDYGPELRTIAMLRRRPSFAAARLENLRATDPATGVPPDALDACFQAIVGAIGRSFDNLCVVATVGRLTVHRPAAEAAWVQASVTRTDTTSFSGQVTLWSADGASVLTLADVGVEALANPLTRFSYQVDWEPAPLRAAPVGESAAPAPVILVACGPADPCIGPLAAAITAARGTATVRAPAELSGALAEHARVVLVASDTGAAQADPVDAARRLTDDALAAVRALAASGFRGELWWVTRGVEAASSPTALAQAPLWGIARSAPLEGPGWESRLVDLDAGFSPEHAASVLLAELLQADGETQIVNAQGGRRVARLRRDAHAEAAAVRLSEEATYLITGGLGGLGLAVAEAMVEAGARTLVLTSRGGLPPQDAWQVLAEQDGPLAGRIRAVQALAARGASVVPFACDVTEPAHMTTLFSEVLAGLPPLRGVVHAAGMVEPTPLRAMTPQDFDRVARAKIAGAWLLHGHTAGIHLDFFVLFSSVAAVLGARDYGHYSAGNAFMDALARHRARQGLPALTVNWGPWNSLGLGNAETRQAMALSGMLPLGPQSARQAFLDVLPRVSGQMMIAQVDWSLFAPIHQARTGGRFLCEVAPAGATDAEVAAPSAASAAVALGDPQVQDRIRARVAQVLGLASPAKVRSYGFLQQGMDSLMVAELARLLADDLRVELDSATIFSHPNVKALAEYLGTKLQAARGRPAPEPDRPPPASEVVERGNSLEALLFGLLEEVLGARPTRRSARRSFIQQGMDSILAADLAARLSQALGSSIPSAVLFERPTPELLLAWLRERHGDAPATAPTPPAPAPAPAPDSPRAAAPGLLAAPSPPVSSGHIHDPERAVAIVGMACRFPGDVQHPDDLWNLLLDGQDVVGPIPRSRFDIDRFYDPDPGAQGTIRTRFGGFLDSVDTFDPDFFNITPREAYSLDPQQRMLLETGWEALEDAGIVPASLVGTTGAVFVGICSTDYHDLQKKQNRPAAIDVYTNTGGSMYTAAGRLSYTLGLQGPCVSVDAACASSLVAVHLARQSLADRETDLALAAGVSLALLPDTFIFLSRSGALSADGRCKAFDAAADGMGRSEGCAVVVLKRLADALRDGDPIYAAIVGSAVGQDGASAGLTVPNGSAQQAVVRRALADARLAPSSVDFVEAHGTGTPVGDPIECRALADVFAGDRQPDHPLILGSIKTNLGHTEAAAGIAGLCKAALALKNRMIPGNLHFTELNPGIDVRAVPFAFPTAAQPWPARGGGRVAGVSSFGLSGTLAHAVLSEIPDQAGHRPEPALDEARGSHILVLSGHQEGALYDTARRVLGGLPDDPAAVRDVCHTALHRRTWHRQRLAASFRGTDELRACLAAYLDGLAHPNLRVGDAEHAPRPLVFVFSGHGSQWHGMADRLLAEEPVFRAAVEECARIIDPLLGGSLMAELAATGERARLGEFAVAQPLIFSMQVGLARLWRARGVEPALVVGHSMGEVAAAHVAGALSLADACHVICLRSRLAARAGGSGRMAVLDLSFADARDFVARHGPGIELASSNGPRSVVVCGSEDRIHHLRERCQSEGIDCRAVSVDVASHSSHVEPALPALRAALAGIAPRPATVPLISTVTGQPIDGAALDAEYWCRNLREPVMFWESVERLGSSHVFLEVSPHPVLVPAMSEGGLLALPSMRRGADAVLEMLNVLGNLVVGGHVEQITGLATSGRPYPLPSYPFQRERYWVEEPPEADEPGTRDEAFDLGRPVAHPLLGRPVPLASPAFGDVWTAAIDQATVPWVREHQVQNVTLLPGTASIDMAVCALLAVTDGDLSTAPVTVRGLRFDRALFLDARTPRRTQWVLHAGGDAGRRFEFFSQGGAAPGGTWVRHSEGVVLREPGRVRPAPLDLAAVRERLRGEVAGAAFYEAFRDVGVRWGASFSTDEAARHADGEAVRRVTPRHVAEDAAHGYLAHPALLDVALQVAFAAIYGRGGDAPFQVPFPFVFHSLESITFFAPLPERLWSYAQVAEGSGAQHGLSHRADVWLVDDEGQVVLEARGLCVEYLDDAFLTEAAVPFDEWLYDVAWEPLPAVDVRSRTLDPRQWLICADDRGIGRAVGSMLERRGAVVHLAGAADGAGEDAAPIDPGAVRPWREPVGRLDPAQPAGVVLVGAGADEPEPEAFADRTLAAAQRLVELVQELEASGVAYKLWIVTVQGQRVAAGERPDPSQAALWGLGRTLAEEHADAWGGLVDVEAGEAAEELGRQVVGEFLAAGREDQVALRGVSRFGARLQALHRHDRAGVPLNTSVTWLVTGGLGDLGLCTAEWLVEHGVRRLGLVGRTGLPPREHWDNAQDEPIRQRVDTIRRLEACGARIFVGRADVGDRSALQAALDAIADDLGPVQAVVHAAGVSHPRVLTELTPALLLEDLQAKVAGTAALLECLGDQLDTLVLFSSAAGVLNSPLLAGYATANAFMDAVAARRRADGKHALTVNWGFWGEIGLAARMQRAGAVAVSAGMGKILPWQGLQALEALLDADVTQAVALPIDWQEWSTAHPTSASARFLSAFASAGDPVPDADRGTGPVPGLRVEDVRAAPAEERLAVIRQGLVGIVASILRTAPERVAVNVPPTELGLDSLTAVELRRRLRKELGVDLSLLYIFAASGLAALAEELHAQLVGGVEAAPAAATRRATENGLAPEQCSFPSADGLTIFGHLSVPACPGPHPVVVVHTANHGGALGIRGDYEHLQEHAALVPAGFAVFTVDQRGAPGHGTDYAARYSFGDRDIDDVLAAAQFAASRPDLDPTNMFFMGTSRGAYAGLLAMSRAPQLWRGAVLNMGVYDPAALLRDQEAGLVEKSGFSLYMGKSADELRDYFARPEHAPLELVHLVTAPLLVIHGEKDRMVPLVQAEELVRRLERHGVPHVTRWIPGLAHDFDLRDPIWNASLWPDILQFLRRPHITCDLGFAAADEKVEP